MTINSALAAVAVADFDEATAYYARLFGREADATPMPTLAQWDLDDGSLQVVENAEHSGHSMATLLVADFDEVVATLRTAGLEPSEPVTGGAVSRFTQLTDPAGNVITVVEVPD